MKSTPPLPPSQPPKPRSLVVPAALLDWMQHGLRDCAYVEQPPPPTPGGLGVMVSVWGQLRGKPSEAVLGYRPGLGFSRRTWSTWTRFIEPVLATALVLDEQQLSVYLPAGARPAIARTVCWIESVNGREPTRSTIRTHARFPVPLEQAVHAAGRVPGVSPWYVLWAAAVVAAWPFEKGHGGHLPNVGDVAWRMGDLDGRGRPRQNGRAKRAVLAMRRAGLLEVTRTGSSVRYTVNTKAWTIGYRVTSTGTTLRVAQAAK